MRIALSKLGKKYNRQWIFRGIDYVFEEGKSYALTGNNGSGKSTLLQIIYNFQTHSEGSVEYKRQASVIAEDQLLTHLSFTAPYLELAEEFTLNEAIRFHFNFKQVRAGHSFSEIITSCGLKGHEEKQVKKFSSGMKQRLKLALAIHSDTSLLLLDEPCSNLDESGISWYRNLMQEGRQGRKVIIASNQKFEYDFCDAVLKMEDYKQ